MKLDKSEISCWKCIRDSFRIGFSCRRTEKICLQQSVQNIQATKLSNWAPPTGGSFQQAEVSILDHTRYLWSVCRISVSSDKKKKKRTAPTGRKFPYWTTPATYVPWTLWNGCSTCFGHSTSSQVKCMGYYLTWVILYPPNTIQTLFYPKK